MGSIPYVEDFLKEGTGEDKIGRTLTKKKVSLVPRKVKFLRVMMCPQIFRL